MIRSDRFQKAYGPLLAVDELTFRSTRFGVRLLGRTARQTTTIRI